MQVLIATAIIFASAVTGSNSSNELAWSSNYGQAKSEAKAAQRPLLIVMEDPSKPETRLDQQASDSELLQKYQLCRIDVTTEYGKKVAKAFNATEFPYTACTDKTASFITFRGAGKMSVEGWKSVLKDHADGAVASAASHTTYKPVFENRTIEYQPSQAVPSYSLPSYMDPTSPSYCPNCVRGQYR